ncbi:hypothetical protein VRU48_16430 [Pedobacter sp. KR3-3]|uniref:Uncharacterized protein n=1 Tax=Pedobacter albus TaxID=3113905 RepID=A0ABU7IB46_9SPHI|nr:hypothetical protein [Pedobacter sp. KR3-3]MEE1946713.1 hypothetical protein [Pedobacter sp. KR3-3]
MDIGRYQMGTDVFNIIDTKTGERYFRDEYGAGYYILDKNGDEVKTKWYPKN